MLDIGHQIPTFSLSDQNGTAVQSSDLLGHYIVLFFYPKDFTPGCTKEVCAFRDQYQEFVDAGAVVIGVSSDSERSHQRFATRHQLPYPLLSDASGKLKRQFGVKSKILGLLPGRETFVFDPDGKLIFKFSSLDATPHIRKTLKLLKEKSNVVKQ